MAFVYVPHGGCYSQCAQGAHPADSKNNFLLYTCCLVATVELVGDDSIMFLVFFQVTVQQVQFYMTCICFPDVQKNLSIREINVNHQRFAIRANDLGDRQRAGFEPGDVLARIQAVRARQAGN